MSEDEKRIPRVFVSYSHDDEEHKRKALALTQALRKSFIDAEIDRFTEDDPPLDWANWMFQELDKADFVIMISTETYQRRVQDQEEPERGRGARWEGAIISNAIYSARRLAASAPFLPVIFNQSDSQFVPFFVAGSTHYLVDPDSGEGIDRLVRRFKGQHQVTRVPLGGEPEPEAAESQPASAMTTGAEFLEMAEAADRPPSDSTMVKRRAERQHQAEEDDRLAAQVPHRERQEALQRAAQRRLEAMETKPHPLGEVQTTEAKRLGLEQTDLDLEAALFDALVAAPNHKIHSDVLLLHLDRVVQLFTRLVSRQVRRTVMGQLWQMPRGADKDARFLVGDNTKKLATTVSVVDDPDFMGALRHGVWHQTEPLDMLFKGPEIVIRRTTYAIPSQIKPDVVRGFLWIGYSSTHSEDQLTVIGRHVVDRLGHVFDAMPLPIRRPDHPQHPNRPALSKQDAPPSRE